MSVEGSTGNKIPLACYLSEQLVKRVKEWGKSMIGVTLQESLRKTKLSLSTSITVYKRYLMTPWNLFLHLKPHEQPSAESKLKTSRKTTAFM